MRRMTGWVIALLMMWGFACAEQVALPWSMTWETTPAEYVRVLEANMGEGCTIAALRDGSAQIDLTISRGDYYSVSCRAVFDGGKERDRVAFVALDELAGEPLRLSWVAIDVAPTGKDMDFDGALELYRALYERFVQEYGEQATERAYLSAAGSGQRISHRAERGPDGLPDWDTIRRDWRTDSDASDSLWLVAGDDHASCRLYATAVGMETGSDWLWRASYFFTRERQAAPFEQYRTGIGAMRAAAIGRQAAVEDTGMTEAEFTAYYRDPDVWLYPDMDSYLLYIYPRTVDTFDGDNRVCQICVDPDTGEVLNLEWTDGLG